MKMKNVAEKQAIKQTMSVHQGLIKMFLALAFVYTLGICAIIRANFNYIDDNGRVAYGYKQWEYFGRYLSNDLSSLIHADTYLTDISPLPQLLAVLIMAISGTIIYYLITDKKEFSIWGMSALIPLGLSPYFLECFSYKYDAPYMALSVLFAVAPVLLCKERAWMYILVSAMGNLGVCLTYQAASGIYPMLVVLMCFMLWNHGEKPNKILRFLGCSIAAYFVGLVIYKEFIMPPTNSYVSNSLPNAGRVIPVALEHLKKYYELVYSDFKREWLVLIGLLAIGFVVSMVNASKQRKVYAAVMAIVTLFAMAALTFGAYLVLEKPLFEPRAMYGFGALIAMVGVVTVIQENYAVRTFCVILSWSFLAFSFTYGNALAAQKEYADFRIEAVVEDLSELEIMKSDVQKTVQVIGSIGFAPVIQNMPQDYKILKRLVPVQFRQKWTWGNYQMLHYYGLKNVRGSLAIDFKDANLPVLKDTIYHTIRSDGQNILIELKD